MTEAEKSQLLEILERIEIKTIEVLAMMKDGKFIVAYEKLGGVTKVTQQLMRSVSSIENSQS